MILSDSNAKRGSGRRIEIDDLVKVRGLSGFYKKIKINWAIFLLIVECVCAIIKVEKV